MGMRFLGYGGEEETKTQIDGVEQDNLNNQIEAGNHNICKTEATPTKENVVDRTASPEVLQANIPL